jgi:hypothetical protein
MMKKCKSARPHFVASTHLFKKADELSHNVNGAAIEIHRLRGPGFIEGIYEKCFCFNFRGYGFNALTL